MPTSTASTASTAAARVRQLIAALERREDAPALLREAVNLLRADLRERQETAERLAASEERLRLALDAADVGIWDWDLAANRVTWDGHHARIFGIDIAATGGDYAAYCRCVHPDDRADAACRVDSARATRSEYDHEYRIVRPDGSVRWVHAKGRFLFDDAGNASRMTGTVVDVTDRRRAEAAEKRLRDAAARDEHRQTTAELEASEQRYRTLFDRNPDGVFAMDPAGRFTTVNPASEQITGYTADQLLGMTFTDLCAPDRRPETIEAFRRCLAGNPGCHQTALIRKDGRRVELLVTGGPVVVEGQVPVVHCCAKDVTERAAAEQALRRSDERLRLALEAGRMGTWEWDVGSDEIRWSDGHYALLGYRVGGVPAVRQTFRRCLHPEDRPVQEAAQRAAMQGRSEYHCEFRVVWPDGSVHWLEARGRFVYDEQGVARRMYGVLADIDQRKAAEAAQAALQEKTAVVSRLRDANVIGIIEGEGERITAANDNFLRMLGYDRSDLEAGRLRWPEFTPPEYAPLDRRALRELAETGACTPFEKEYLRRDGTRVPVLIGVAATAAGTDARTLRWVSYVMDLTERRHADRALRESEAALRLAKEAAESANRAKDQFLGMVSHDLRTPLSSIRLWARMLRHSAGAGRGAGPGLDASVLEAVESIERAVGEQVRLVDDLLDVTRIAHETFRVEVGPCDLSAVAAEAVEATRPAAAAKGLTLTADLGHPTPPALADAGRVRQVLGNLLGNAVKFTEPGGRVAVRLERDGERVRMLVADTGAGIDPAFLPHVFDRFAQAQGSGRRTGGLGLGLSIVRSIVEAHGGTVAAHSDGPGRGATFTISLPLVRAGQAR